ncbi:flavin-containing monooxygenase [Nocardioides jejuensis]|uniref:NAD(P)/FAD-dependent oxidoreductase n=1 Tax=Nocardioides jejuensis TaxID=2502782 RepID=A0A4R1C0C5_9ACTN|nr:NAD(P)/FAD-dependent oxidoreductase [Nocardioides jejuensis]TCJ23893.1 NAD(P)/FAD-dependent oxidoreductase [Nocardioides jejuensis]
MSTIEHHDVVIVGAGFSGIGVAIALKKAGFEDVLLVDDADGAGGVWHWNTYPGVAVDIPSFSYQFSYAQRSDWSRSYAKGAELKQYADRLVADFDLADQIRFETRVTSAAYDEEECVWDVATSTGDLTATHVVHAGGPLSQPKYPDIAGLDSFAGTVMHTARWDHAADLAGKRVAIIGTGASAVQIIPSIAADVEHLTVFQRTPIWCLPKADFPLVAPLRAGLGLLPGAKRVARLASDLYVEATFPFLAHYGGALQAGKVLEPMALSYLKSQVDDPETREKLTPRYGLGCKRPSFHNSYLSTFNRDNVALETGGIKRITETGVVTADGVEHAVDVLLLATGFKVTEKDALPGYDVAGREGVLIADWWETDRLQSYQGVSAPGYPNFFTTFGPYGYNGSSYFQLVEATASHIVRVLTEARRRGAAEVEVTSRAHERYMASVRKRRGPQVFWQPSCAQANSYYFTKDGDVPLRPGFTPEVRWRNAHFPLNDYAYAYA